MTATTEVYHSVTFLLLHDINTIYINMAHPHIYNMHNYVSNTIHGDIIINIFIRTLCNGTLKNIIV